MNFFNRGNSTVSTIEWSKGYDEQKASLVPCEDSIIQLKTFTPKGYIPCDCYTQSSLPSGREEERKMAYCCLRAFPTLLHLTISGAAGFLCIYSIIGWDSAFQCLPQLFNIDKSKVSFVNGLPTVCDFVVFGLSGISFINLLMCVTLNVRWIHSCVMYCNLVLMLIFGTVLTFGSSMFTIHYMLWCDSMQQIYNQSCSFSANNILPLAPTSIITYKDRLELQQIIMWAMCPVSLVLVLAYVLALRLSAASDYHREQSGSYRYVPIPEERAPLLPPEYQPNRSTEVLRQSNRIGSDYWTAPPPPAYHAAALHRSATPLTSPMDNVESADSVSIRTRSQTGNSNTNPFV